VEKRINRPLKSNGSSILAFHQSNQKVIYVDPAWIQKNFTSYPKKVIFSHYPEPMMDYPTRFAHTDIILVTHHHQDHVKTVTLPLAATKLSFTLHLDVQN
jgi:L-ascorbate metabolism protein UlaG (beta-lactamase superfamily)